MKFIKFILSTKKQWTFPEEEAKKIIMSEKQIYPIIESDGKFHGRTINKAHIVETDFDLEAEKRWNDEKIANTPKLGQGERITEAQRKKNLKRLEEMRKELIKKKVIKK